MYYLSMTQQSRAYAAPAIVVVGTVAEVTQGYKTPVDFIDATFPAHTPASRLTYS